MSPTFAEGSVRVTTPSNYEARAVIASRGLPDPADLPAVTSKDALVEALEASDLRLMDSVDLAPRRTRGLGDEPEDTSKGTVQLEVDIPAEEDAVVLLERDGVYSWHLPVEARTRTRALDAATHTRRFEIDVRPQPTEEPGDQRTDRRDRGLLGSIVEGAAQALVFRFVAPVVVDKAIDAMEAHVRPGLVHLTDAEVSSWHPFESLDELHLPTDRPVRLLLLVHGTFSSTKGAFGVLSADENGQGFLRALISAYDAVIGYDHKTLSVGPLENAEDLLGRLAVHKSNDDVVIDVVAHSRGGLVTRSFVEQVLPASTWPGRVDNIVFVASTNAGTHLANPKRWSDLVDLYTNLAAVTARVLSLVPAAAPVGAVVSGVVKGIGAFVKYLVSYAAEGDDVPGLKAMVPGGEFVTEINKMQRGQPGPGTSWFVISSNFHVSVFDDHHNPPEFPRELAVKLAEGFVDKLFKGDNDLVVEVSSMSAIGLPAGGFVRDQLELGENDVVYHNNYFAQLSVMEAISGWLPMGLGAGGEEMPAEASSPPPPFPESAPPPAAAAPAASAPSPQPRDGHTNGGGDISGDFSGGIGSSGDRRRGGGGAVTAPPSPPVTRGIPPMQRQPEPAAAAAPPLPSAAAPAAAPQTTTASLAAEMPGHVLVEQEYVVRVRLSRNAIAPSEGAVHAEETVEVDETRPLSVHAVGKANAEIVGTDTDLFALPPGGGTSELQFKVRAPAVGASVVTMVVKQGSVPIATLRLETTAVDDAATMPLATMATGSVHMGTDAPELENLACIDIFERELSNNRVAYQYAVRLEPGTAPLMFESKPMKDRQKKIATILDDVARAWRDSDAEPKERERRLQDIGSKMFDELFPEDMQDYLWRNRELVRDLIVYADEPFVPWELVHLKPPIGPREEKPRFLAQCGLVRWQPGSLPPREMHVRAGRARTLVPDYKDPLRVLPEAALEREFVEERFEATKVTATPAGVRELLRSGRFDLLHFSGHGAANLENIIDAKLLLQGLKRAGTVVPQYLGATTVSENATWAQQGTAGPIVVLNACQVGLAGELLTTVGGFAKAFLDAGASAFVSCLWSVRDQPSRLFVEKLYDELLAGTQISVASARARKAARQAGDATWLAFVVYARPDAVLVRS